MLNVFKKISVAGLTGVILILSACGSQNFQFGYERDYAVGGIKIGGKTYEFKGQLKKRFDKEGVESFYFPQTPGKSSIVYLSTSEPVGDNLKKNRIYSYGLSFGTLRNLYLEEAPRVLRTLGMDGSKLVLAAEDLNASSGPCFSYWYDDWKEFIYLNIDHPEDGLQSYNMPESVIGMAKQKREECLEKKTPSTESKVK